MFDAIESLLRMKDSAESDIAHSHGGIHDCGIGFDANRAKKA